MKRAAVQALAVFATTTAVLSAGMGVAQAAGSTITLNDTGTGGCVKVAPWGASGSFEHVSQSDQFYWNNARSLHVNYSNVTGDLWGCINGYNYSGGSKAISVRWQVFGTKLSSCSLGTSGVSCNINSADTVATDTYSWSGSNTDGRLVFKSGGNNVYAATGGSIDQYTINSTVTFNYNGYITRASTANTGYRNV